MSQNVKRLNRYLEFFLDIFYIFMPIVGYNIIRFIVVDKSPREMFNDIGFMLFVLIFIVTIILLFFAESIKLYIKNTNERIYYNLDFKVIIPIVVVAIIFFEIFLIQ